MTRLAAAALLLLIVGGPALADQPSWTPPAVPKAPLADRVAICAAIVADARRLECYDSLTDRPDVDVDAPPPARAPSGPLAEFAGNGITNTRPFTTYGPWQLEWTATGSFFSIYVYDGSGRLVGVAANQAGPGSGSSYEPKAGTYYLTINALGSWQVRAVPAP